VGSITEDPNLNVGMQSSMEVKNMHIYPNPSNGEFTVQNIPANARSFELFDQAGRFILGQKITKEGLIRLNELSDGTYIFSVVLSDGQRSTSMIQIKN
jgi:regulation of enolase protein 1 (concanavalin A-like superfamily)